MMFLESIKKSISKPLVVDRVDQCLVDVIYKEYLVCHFRNHQRR
jgi:hypothetical protein